MTQDVNTSGVKTWTDNSQTSCSTSVHIYWPEMSTLGEFYKQQSWILSEKIKEQQSINFDH